MTNIPTMTNPFSYFVICIFLTMHKIWRIAVEKKSTVSSGKRVLNVS